MSKEFIVPKTSPEIARQVYQEVEEDQTAFLRKEAQIFERENPQYLGSILRASIATSVQEDSRFPAQRIMSGIFFRYECTRRELEKVGGKIPLVGDATFSKTIQEVKSLITPSPLIVISLTPENPLVRLNRLRTTRIENDDPSIGEIIKALNRKPHIPWEIDDVFSFIEGVHTSHLNLMLFEETEFVEPKTPQTSSLKVPVVKGEIVRTALLETILDQQGFVDSTFERLLDYAPSMVTRIRRFTHSTIGSDPNSYQLLASLTAFCVMEEFLRRGMKFPVIGDSQIRNPDPEIARLQKSEPNSDLTSMSIKQFNMSVLREIADTNQELFEGVKNYLSPLSDLEDQGFALSSAINGTVSAYTTIKGALI